MAVKLGNDTDTIAAIVGSLSGLFYGINSFPKEWLDKLKQFNLIDSLCNRFEASIIKSGIYNG